ncbi:uncharacterized protein LOC107264458 [Cephus cinctus]|uniref:Uncharacterized protein LOC107264458 n=1 Tax=Cephus cinctus TaxID=211228 RepID=A0AAJ7BKG9_CEPCN|nr:uncharacterized protein LOC107264458 [Cephus cinctus]
MSIDTESVKNIAKHLKEIAENVRIERIKDLTHSTQINSTDFNKTEDLYVSNNADEQLILLKTKSSEIHDKCSDLLHQINSITIMQEKALMVLESNHKRHKMFDGQMEICRQAYDSLKSDIVKKNRNKIMPNGCAFEKLAELIGKRDKLNEKLASLRKTIREDSSRLTEVNEQIFQQSKENKLLLKNLRSQLKNLEVQRKDAATKLEQLQKVDTNV